MKSQRPHPSAMILIGMLLITSSALAQPEQEPIVLSSTGLPSGKTPEAVLPAGALAHVRLRSAGSLLDDTNDMLVKFIPEKMLPPPLLPVMEEDNPLLALIGLQTAGQPLSVKQLSGMTGIDAARPVTFSYYMMPPPDGFILSLPVTGMPATSALLSGMLKHRKFDKVEIEGGSAFQISLPNQQLFVLCAEDAIYVCGCRPLAEALLNTPHEAKLNQSTIVTGAIKTYAKENLLIVLDAGPLKPLLPMIERYRTIPQPAIDQLRGQILDEIKPNAQLNLRLRMQFGLRDVDQLLDLAEAMSTATYEVLFEYLYNKADQFDGVSFTLDVGEEFQTARMSIYSKAFTVQSATKSLNLKEVGRAIRGLPGAHNYLVFQGQRRASETHPLADRLLGRIGEKLGEKDLPMRFYKTVLAAVHAHRPSQSLESRVPWTITTRFVSPSKRPDAYASLQEYIGDFAKGLGGGAVSTVKAIPQQKEGFLEDFYQQQADTTNHNDKVYRQFLEKADWEQPFYTKNSRTASHDMGDGVKKLVLKNSFLVPWGLFGYNEHELINRSFTLYRNTGSLTLMYPGGSDPTVIKDIKPQPIPPAVRRLLLKDKIPTDVHRLEMARSLHLITNLFDYLASFEVMLHNDLERYLAAVRKSAGPGPYDERTIEKIAELEMPFTVMQLKTDEDGEPYLTTPVGWSYPRPKILPEVAISLEEFRELSDSVGGAAIYQRSADGQYEVVAVQSTAALAALVRTVGNSIATRYMHDPEGMPRLQKIVQTELDEASRLDPAVLTNTFWEFLAPPEPIRY